MRTAKILNVLIASPSDVVAERDLVCDAINKWNSAHSLSRGINLQPVRWEVDATPEMGDRPQAIINRQFVDGADLLLGIFWTRLGTPTGQAASGTTEEIERFCAAAKPVCLYFSDKPTQPSTIDLSQYAALQEYKSECESKGLFDCFKSLEELREKVERALTKIVTQLLDAEIPHAQEVSEVNCDDPVVRLENAFRVSADHARNDYKRFLSSLNVDIERTKPDFTAFEHIDEAIVVQIEMGWPAVQRFFAAVDVSICNNVSAIWGDIYKKFGDYLKLYELPDGFSGRYDAREFDGFKVIIHTMFVGFISLLVKAEKWVALGDMLKTKLFVDLAQRGGYVPFIKIRDYPESLEISRKNRLRLNQHSIATELLRQFFQSETDLPLDFSDFMAGDYFLWLHTMCNEENSKWYPQSIKYLNRPPSFIRKCESKQYLLDLAEGMGVSSALLMKQLVEQTPPVSEYVYWGYDVNSVGSIP